MLINLGLLPQCLFFPYREKNQLDEDRRKLPIKNKAELCEKVNIETGEVLDVLIKEGVITQIDKTLIMVVFSSLI